MKGCFGLETLEIFWGTKRMVPESGCRANPLNMFYLFGHTWWERKVLSEEKKSPLQSAEASKT